jgi:aspartyl-tRNA(Asn)/glutamyl-tRNA(Gln) amidotransferase subunit C
MAITEDQVRYVAHLSRLNLSDEEVETFGQQLDEIISYVEKLNELDTSDVEPMIHAADVENVFRDDEAGESLSRREALRNAPDDAEGCFKVPRILD